MLLENKVAIVTGSARGIGEAIALALGRHGANVVTNAVSNIRLAEAVSEKIRTFGRESFAFQADIAKADDIKRLFDLVADKFSHLDILVNNAATFIGLKPFYDVALQDWDHLMSVNLRGAFLCSQHAARMMIPQKSGVIINISSGAALTPMNYDVTYATAKGGMDSMTRGMSVDLGPYGIRVIGASPGHFDTKEVMNWAQGEVGERLLTEIPLGRIGKRDEFAELTAFLCSDLCTYLTGQTLQVEGGLLSFGGKFIE